MGDESATVLAATLTWLLKGAVSSISWSTGLQINGGPRSLSHDFKIWPITFQGSGPNGPIPFSCEKISF